MVAGVERLIIRADGAARGNPGPAAAGAVLIDASRPDARRADAPPVAVVARPLGIQTNNHAEYKAVVLALHEAQRLGAREVELVLDSKLAVEQLSGRWKVRNPALAALHAEAQRMLAGFRRWTARHEPRASNHAADALANLALDDPAAAAEAERAYAGVLEPAAANTSGADEPVGSAAVGAACAIFDDDGRVLLVHHTYGGRMWGLPGGYSLPGESPDATARRELEEETGLALEPAGLTGVYFERDDERLGPSLHFVFRFAWSQSLRPVPRPPEIDDVAIASPDDLPRPMSRFTLRRIRDAAAPGTAFAVLEPGERA